MEFKLSKSFLSKHNILIFSATAPKQPPLRNWIIIYLMLRSSEFQLTNNLCTGEGRFPLLNINWELNTKAISAH